MKFYGQIIQDASQLTDEQIKMKSPGVKRIANGYQCLQCESTIQAHFYSYYSEFEARSIVYCRHCLQMGRMDTVRQYIVTQSHRKQSEGNYAIPFQLSEQQAYASEQIVKAIQSHQSLLLHAVTGAGKTEMIFEGISQARRLGYNVAIVSPRVDVVIEVSERILAAFDDGDIDVLYQGHAQQYDAHFVIATVHQLYRFKQHFHVIMVDEVDAFPLSMDISLSKAITSAARPNASFIYMTATPPKALKKQFDQSHIIILPARFHRHPLVLPQFSYLKVKYHRIQHTILQRLRQQQAQQRTTLLFFNDIKQMMQFFQTYQPHLKDFCFVYSEDPERLQKVADLRKRKYSIVLTTTILERGFTMAHLDVWVMDIHRYQASALIQISGRVGTKIESPSGDVIFFHEGRTLAMYQARAEIKAMNRLAKKKGWIDG